MPRTIVVKLGTNLVTDAAGRPDAAVLSDVARQAEILWSEGRRLAIVSSGAVGAGLAALGIARRPRDLADLQAAAAVGQPALMTAWASAMATVGLRVGQVLLTREDADDRGRFLNVRSTVAALWRAGAVPILNENDSVSTAELARGGSIGADSFGDNDQLSAAVASALSAELLVLLSTVPGLLDADGRVVPRVTGLADVASLVRPDTSAGGTGGMASKLAAARLTMAAGEPMVLAGGRDPDALLRAVRGEPGGTRFEPMAAGRLTGRLRWIATARPCGTLHLDAGAARAVRDTSASLLPAGVVGVDGAFVRGDVVRLLDPTGREIAKGLTSHDAAVARQMLGRRSRDLPALLGESFREELVHRDNLVLG